jgi:succinyl-diaminopimelate desuccinylase
MKGAIAAFVAACRQIIRGGEPDGSLSLLITGDEEGEAIDGTRRVIEHLQAEGERIDHCIVGEPTSDRVIGDTIKIGRRGSLNAWIKVAGVQGHVAYPHRAANPAPVLIRLLDRLSSHRFDDASPAFQSTNLEVTDLSINNGAANVIPADAYGRVNIRFNASHRGETLARWLQEHCRAAEVGFSGAVSVTTKISGEAFLTAPGAFTTLVADAVERVAAVRPVLSTTGGTSDARFIRDVCPVVELGLRGSTMHQLDEQTPVADLERLTSIYAEIIRSYFQTPCHEEADGMPVGDRVLDDRTV